MKTPKQTFKNIYACLLNPNVVLVLILFLLGLNLYIMQESLQDFLKTAFSNNTLLLSDFEGEFFAIDIVVMLAVFIPMLIINIVGVVLQFVKRRSDFFSLKLLNINKAFTIPVILLLSAVSLYNMSVINNYTQNGFNSLLLSGINEVSIEDIYLIKQENKNAIIFASKDVSGENEDIEEILIEFANDYNEPVYKFDVLQDVLSDEDKRLLLEYNITLESAPVVVIVKYGVIQAVFTHEDLTSTHKFIDTYFSLKIRDTDFKEKK